MIELAVIALLAAAGWFLWDSLQAREAANAAIRPACRAEGLLFLDDTVALDRLRPGRDEEGRLRLARVYRFDYSDTGHDRRRGSVRMLGARVVSVDLHARAPAEEIGVRH
ncbi:MAG: DUF3301 domain-containing protein [Burkholderiales bacterium]|nr:DUF3301 domain-containing protein [Burkholderiales bacterium]